MIDADYNSKFAAFADKIKNNLKYFEIDNIIVFEDGSVYNVNMNREIGYYNNSGYKFIVIRDCTSVRLDKLIAMFIINQDINMLDKKEAKKWIVYHKNNNIMDNSFSNIAIISKEEYNKNKSKYKNINKGHKKKGRKGFNLDDEVYVIDSKYKTVERVTLEEALEDLKITKQLFLAKCRKEELVHKRYYVTTSFINLDDLTN